MFFLSSADFFQNQLFRKNLSGIPSEWQTVWIQIRPNILSGLIWVQTVCKGYKHMTLVDKKLSDVKLPEVQETWEPPPLLLLQLLVLLPSLLPPLPLVLPLLPFVLPPPPPVSLPPHLQPLPSDLHLQL